MKALIFFEDTEEGIEIGVENVLSDNPTEAQAFAARIFEQIRDRLNFNRNEMAEELLGVL